MFEIILTFAFRFDRKKRSCLTRKLLSRYLSFLFFSYHGGAGEKQLFCYTFRGSTEKKNNAAMSSSSEAEV